MTTLDDRVAAAERVLDRKGCIHLSSQLWPGATEAATEFALRGFYETVEALDLDVEVAGDRSRYAFRPDTPVAEREALKRRLAAPSN